MILWGIVKGFRFSVPAINHAQMKFVREYNPESQHIIRLLGLVCRVIVFK